MRTALEGAKLVGARLGLMDIVMDADRPVALKLVDGRVIRLGLEEQVGTQ